MTTLRCLSERLSSVIGKDIYRAAGLSTEPGPVEGPRAKLNRLAERADCARRRPGASPACPDHQIPAHREHGDTATDPRPQSHLRQAPHRAKAGQPTDRQGTRPRRARLHLPEELAVPHRPPPQPGPGHHAAARAAGADHRRDHPMTDDHSPWTGQVSVKRLSPALPSLIQVEPLSVINGKRIHPPDP